MNFKDKLNQILGESYLVSIFYTLWLRLNQLSKSERQLAVAEDALLNLAEMLGKEFPDQNEVSTNAFIEIEDPQQTLIDEAIQLETSDEAVVENLAITSLLTEEKAAELPIEALEAADIFTIGDAMEHPDLATIEGVSEADRDELLIIIGEFLTSLEETPEVSENPEPETEPVQPPV